MKKIKKLFLASTGLVMLTTGLSSCASSIASVDSKILSDTSEVTPEVEKFDLMFLLDERYEVTDCEGFTLDENGYALVEKGTQIKFGINVLDGVKLGKEGLIVKVNGNEIGEIDGVYKTTINKDTEITVEGFVESVGKYRVQVNAAYGVNVVCADYEPYPDNSYLLEEGMFIFKLDYLTGFKADNLLVKVNGEEVNEEDGYYSIKINKNIVIEVSGVKYEQLQISMAETDLFSYFEVKGATLKNEIAYVNSEEVSFKILPSKLADLDKSEIVVKNGDQTLTPVNGTYTIKPTSNSEITVTGLVKASEYSEVTKLTFEKEVLADCAVTPIISTTGGSLVGGPVSDMLDIENGYKKSTYYAGEYGKNQISLNSNETFQKFSYLEFEINPFTGDFIEFYSPLSTKPMFYIYKKGWTNIKLKIEEDGFHYYVNGEDKGLAATPDMLISTLEFRMQGSYLFTELIGQKDASYLDPHHYIDTPAVSSATEVYSSEETEYGIKKWYGPVNSKINKPVNLSSLNPSAYSEIYFEVMVPEDYGSVVWFGVGVNPSWEVKPGNVGKFIFTKNASETFDLTFIGSSTKNVYGIDFGEDTAGSAIYGHGSLKEGSSNVGKFYVSNFRLVDDPEYDPNGQKSVVINNNAEHVTYTVDGQTGSSFKVDKDTTLILRTSVEAGYVEIVKANGSALKGNNGVYEIIVSKNTTIDIYEDIKHDIEMVAEKFIDNDKLVKQTYDNSFASIDPNVDTMYKNTAQSGTKYSLSNIDISAYKHLYFYVYNLSGERLQLYQGSDSDAGFTGVGEKGKISTVSFDNNNGTWTVSIDGVATDKYTKTTTTLAGIFYAQFWGVNLLSPLYGYKN